MHTHRFTQHDDPVCQVSHELQEVQVGVQVTLRVIGAAVGSPTAKSMSSGGHMILTSLEVIAESGRPPLGTRLMSAMFDRQSSCCPHARRPNTGPCEKETTMSDPRDATATQLRNIETKTGKTLAQLRELIAQSGLAKHGEVRAMLMERLALGYGDANTLAHAAREAPPAAAAADPLDAIYAGPKAALRPLHDAIMKHIAALGAFEVAPKKSYVSLRRKKQFAMVGPATKDLIEIGLNAKALPEHPRLKAMPPGGMCQYTVRVGQPAEIDAMLAAWIRSAYDAAG